MKKVVLIDDEPLARMVVSEYLQSFPQLHIVKECSDGFEGVKAIQQYMPDLIFLDIQMPKINGFEMLELLEKPPAVIFTTAFDEYAIRAFEAHAVDYLLKPFSKDRFDKAVSKWLETPAISGSRTRQLMDAVTDNPVQNNRIVVKNGSKIKIIPLSDIFYLEASDDFVKVHTAEGHFLKGRTMAYFEKILDASAFCRCHRSYLINTHYITRIEPYEKDNHVAVLKNGEQLAVSRAGYSKLREVLGL